MSKEGSVVTFLGPEGSYTHQATLDTFPPTNSQTTPHTLRPVPTIEDVFASIQSGSAHRGIVPFENSSNGSVVFTLDLFADLDAQHPDIVVCGEAYVRVRHCLVVHPGNKKKSDASTASADPGISASSTQDIPPPPTSLAHITKVYSHPQAWGQCKTFLHTHLKHTERQDVSSTSRAAELAKQDASGSSAAISSGIAAKLLGLKVLVEGIEDRAGNCTRFLVLRRRENIPTSPRSAVPAPTSTLSSSSSSAVSQSDSHKTLLAFTVPHADPGALARSLSVFARYSINLTSINTRPSGVENWNYIFFVELQGRVSQGEGRESGDGDAEGEGKLDQALRDLEGVCRWCRWLGSWESGLVR